MAKDDVRYQGTFFTSYTNTRMKLARHCVPLDDDPAKIALVYGYDLAEVENIFGQLACRRQAIVDALRAKFGQALDEKLAGKPQSIVFIGDQLSSEYLGCFHLVKCLLNPYPQVSVSMAGNTGDTSNQSLQYIYSLAVSQRPTITAFLIGTNDAYRTKDAYRKTVASPQEYRSNLDCLVKVMRHYGSKVLLNTLPPFDSAAAEKAYAHMNWECSNEVLDEFNDIIRNTAQQNDCKLNDVAQHFKTFEQRITLPDDGVLLTAEAQQFLTEHLLYCLLEML